MNTRAQQNEQLLRECLHYIADLNGSQWINPVGVGEKDMIQRAKALHQKLSQRFYSQNEQVAERAKRASEEIAYDKQLPPELVDADKWKCKYDILYNILDKMLNQSKPTYSYAEQDVIHEITHTHLVLYGNNEKQI